MRSPVPRLFGALAAVTLLAWCSLVVGSDWTSWRGPFQDGVSPDKNLPATWSDEKGQESNFLWKAPVGCRSTPIVMKGRVYINNQVGEGVNEQERVMCFDAETGKVLWEKHFGVFLTDIVSVRLGWTNMVGDPATGNLYWHGTQGFFICFDKDGKILWQHQLTEQFGRVSGYGGRLPSPALAENLVVIGMNNSSWGDHAKGGNRFLAMDKLTGTPVWWSEPGEKPLNSNYSTPTVATINGELLFITGGADGSVHAMQARTGKKVWSYNFCAGEVNCSPVVDGSLIYCNHGQENPDNNIQGRVLCLDASQIKDGKPKLVWQVDGIKAKYTSPLLKDGRLYIGDDVAKLWCLDAKSGAKIWYHIYGRNAMASPVWGDSKIYVSDKNAKFHILEPGDKKCKVLDTHRFVGAAGNDVELYGNAAVANGRVYFSTSEELYCIGAKAVKADADAVMKPVASQKGKPAQLLIVPCDVETHPGKSVEFKLRAYDEHGNFVQDLDASAAVQWALPQPPLPPGAKNQPPALKADLSGKGGLSTVTIKAPPAAPPAQQGYVAAQWNGLTAKARVRVCPVLPYEPNFTNIPAGAVPGSWINCQGKFVIKELDKAKHVLAKVTNNSNALVARGSCLFGTPEMTDYTIQADVYGGKVPNKTGGDWMPDVGVGACRYTLYLGGPTQTLRLVSWEAMQRVDETIQHAWKADTWYTLKLMADIKGGKATLRGKVWPKGQTEPTNWLIEFTDPTPNLEGSAFLYGYSVGQDPPQTGTEVYYDNVKVTPNKR
jgi:outer membrane protein assembly factor BamB